MMCFSRPKSRIRVDDLIDGLILQIMTMIERKSSARAKAAREGLAIRSNFENSADNGAHVRLVARALSVH